MFLVSAALPPQPNGIGDYTAQLAAALARTGAVEMITVLTACGQKHAPIPGVTITPAFDPDQPRTVRQITSHLAATPDNPPVGAMSAAGADWLLLQYNPFSFGRWGVNPYLSAMVRQVQRTRPGTRFALMIHEPFVRFTDARSLPLAVWQRAQLFALGRRADVVLVSIEPWRRELAAWFGVERTVHLPVGSNIGRVAIARGGAARARLNIPPDALVLGLFGAAGRGRTLEALRRSVDALTNARPERPVRVLTIGPDDIAVQNALVGAGARGDVTIIAAGGPLDPDEVSRRFAAMDICLAPYVDGVSTRRTSLMTALQHGVAVVGTRGHTTDPLLENEDGRAFLLAGARDPDAFAAHVVRLAEDAGLRAALAGAGKRLFETHFTWERIAALLMETLLTRAKSGRRG